MVKKKLLTARLTLEVGSSAAAAFERPTLNPPEGGGLCHSPGAKSRLAIMPANKFNTVKMFNVMYFYDLLDHK